MRDFQGFFHEKVIVTTTINPPTEAIEKFQSMPDWDLVVIGDKKTPSDYRLNRGIYVSPEEQEKYDPALSAAIGWNCIQRRSFGFLWAKDMQADVVAAVDDDNIPLAGWGENLLVGSEVKVHYYETDLPAFDPVGATNHGHLWHRGFPLQLLSKRDYTRKKRKTVRVDVQADFWNGDPDIDAFCRMEHAPECTFAPDCFPMAANKLGPSIRRTRFSAATACATTSCSRTSAAWTIYGPILSPGPRLSGRLEQGLGLPAAQRPRPDRDMKQEYPGLRAQPTAR